jgi:hypothetical protein
VHFCAFCSCRRTRCANCRSGYLCSWHYRVCFHSVLSFLRSSPLYFSVLLLLLTLGEVQAVCPYCFGNFGSCTYYRDRKCPAVDVPAANAAVVAAGAGLLSLVKVIKPRFLRAFSTVSFDTILALVKRAEPEAPFEFDKATPSTTLLTAVGNGRVTLDVVVPEALRVYGGGGRATTPSGLRSSNASTASLPQRAFVLRRRLRLSRDCLTPEFLLSCWPRFQAL